MSAQSASPGRRLREAREALGKDLSQMAKETRIKVQQLDGLEQDRYDTIPAPMYVRGFIKIYAQELGLNPDPLLEQYERIRTGEPLEEVRPVPRAPARPMDEDEVFASIPPPRNDPAPVVASRPPRLPDLKTVLGNVDVSALATPRVLGIAGGVVVLLALLLTLRGCAGGEDEVAGPEPLPEAEHPLLHEPGPVYFNLPRSLQ